MKGKKSSLQWDEIGKWALALMLIIVVLIAIGLITGSLGRLWDKVGGLFRFG
jgi:phosphotransferase system  glucose/maltose/N-acetylglucosamine-specific IIC component